MSNRVWVIPVCVGMLAGLFACGSEPEQERLRILPESASPGATVVVDVPGVDEKTRAESIGVVVGERPAIVQRFAREAGVAFLVPDLPAGDAEVTVTVDGRPIGSAALTIEPHRARHLVLRMAGEKIELVANRGASGLAQPNREVPEFKALAYDVLSADGVVVATGALSHPLAGRREVHEEDGSLRGAPEKKAAVFTLRIPALPRGGSVRFYEVGAGVDLATEEGRAQRRELTRIEVGGQSS